MVAVEVSRNPRESPRQDGERARFFQRPARLDERTTSGNAIRPGAMTMALVREIELRGKVPGEGERGVSAGGPSTRGARRQAHPSYRSLVSRQPDRGNNRATGRLVGGTVPLRSTRWEEGQDVVEGQGGAGERPMPRPMLKSARRRPPMASIRREGTSRSIGHGYITVK